MRQRTEKITIVFTYDEMPLGKLGARLCKRRMDVYGDGDIAKNKLLFCFNVLKISGHKNL